MEKYIYDERNGLWYEKQGDYYLPCLELPEEETHSIGIWGQRRLRYIKQHRKILYCNLLTSGKLNEHLVEIDTSACHMAEFLIKEIAIRQGITEKLKAQDMMKWVGMMNNIRSCVDEIVLNDIVYS